MSPFVGSRKYASFSPPGNRSAGRGGYPKRRCAFRLVCRGWTRDFIELLCIIPEDLPPSRLLTVREAASDPGVYFVAIERGRMRKVGLEEDVVNADLVDQAA